MEKKVVVGQIALLQESKQQKTVIRAVMLLRERGIDACALFIGDARPEDAAYAEMLLSFTKDMGMEPYVAFLGRRDDVPDLLAAIDVLMIPSSFEGFPLAGLEAAAAGVPVAAAAVGGGEEFVRVSKGGLCFAYDDAQDAAEKIVEIMEQRQEIAQRAKAFAKDRSYCSFADAMDTIFSRV